MASDTLSPSQERLLVSRWGETGAVLESQRRAELATQSATASRQAAFDMLQLGGMLPADAARERVSGMIEMQRLFSRGHRSERP